MRDDELRSEPKPRVVLDPEEIADRATLAYQGLCRRFDEDGSPINFDFRQHCLDWTSRGDHYTHRLHRYPARLTPYIPLFFLGVRGVAVSGGRLLDPFAGCGTVLVEAPVHPSHPMHPVGFEINPLARLIAKVKTTPLERPSVAKAWERILARYAEDRSQAGLPSFPNKRHWFTPVVERRLARALRALDGLKDTDLRDFFLVALSSIVRHVSLADPSVSVPVRIDPTRFHNKVVRAQLRANFRTRETADVIGCLDAAVRNNFSRLESWSQTASMRIVGAIVGADARTFRTSTYLGRGALDFGSGGSDLPRVDLVLTSPPYANAQRYTRSLRLELFVLGFTAGQDDECALDVLQVGTERVRHKDWGHFAGPTGSSKADVAIQTIQRKDKHRAAIIGKYVRDMAIVIKNCHDALLPGGHTVFVIGNNSVRGTVVDNASILVELGTQSGLIPALVVRNKIPSRGLLTKRHPTAGVITHEHVIVMRKPKHAQLRN
jgi:hypothetical protein